MPKKLSKKQREARKSKQMAYYYRRGRFLRMKRGKSKIDSVSRRKV